MKKTIEEKLYCIITMRGKLHRNDIPDLCEYLNCTYDTITRKLRLLVEKGKITPIVGSKGCNVIWEVKNPTQGHTTTNLTDRKLDSEAKQSGFNLGAWLGR